jgi:hypothetical protein
MLKLPVDASTASLYSMTLAPCSLQNRESLFDVDDERARQARGEHRTKSLLRFDEEKAMASGGKAVSNQGRAASGEPRASSFKNELQVPPLGRCCGLGRDDKLE